MRKANLSHESLGRAVGRDKYHVWRALSGRLTVEQAGEMCRALGDAANLTTSERKEVFAELVNWPHELDRPLATRVLSESPMEELKDAVRERYGDYPESVS